MAGSDDVKRLTRDPDNGMVAGVAAGIAAYLDVDPVLVRLGFVLAALVNGIGAVVYVACWILVPRPDAPPAADGTAPADRVAEEVREAGERVKQAGTKLAGELHEKSTARGGAIAGVVLIVIGVVFLLERFDLFSWWEWDAIGRLWPLLLILIGIAIVIDATRRSKT